MTSKEPGQNATVLLVDDEINILNGYKRTLRRSFDLITAESGDQALQLMRANDSVQVLVSDMRMPEMNGLELLQQTRHEFPDVVRIMLTGNADQQTAINAINEGEIFRFLSKPCAAEDLARSINEGIEQYRLKRLEQDMLKNTLRGAIKALTEVLSLVNPEAFGRTVRITNLTVEIAHAIGMKRIWFLESLAMLSQLGCIILPEEVLEILYRGGNFNEEQRQLFEMHPAMGANIIAKIPRLESMADSIQYQMKNFDGSGIPVDGMKGMDIPVGSRILRVVTDYDNLLVSGLSEREAFATMQAQQHLYDPNVVKSLRLVLKKLDDAEIHQVSTGELRVGMRIMQDVTTTDGLLLINKGHQVSDALLAHLKLFSRERKLKEPIHVTMADNNPLAANPA